MADIHLRFNKDMLVLSSPIEAELARVGVNVEDDWAYMLMFEPELLDDAYKLEATAGAQCMVADTARLTPLSLRKANMLDAAPEMVKHAMAAADAVNPQHVLVEIGPCGLPLDVSSKASLVENRDQYSRAAKLFADAQFDAFFLNGFRRIGDLKCALMGIRKVSDVPIFASVGVDAQGYLLGSSSNASATPERLEDAVLAMQELGADVCGFATDADVADIVACIDRVKPQTMLPFLVQLCVTGADASGEAAGAYVSPDDMIDAADELRAAGVQFLRAAGCATPAYTGALVAATERLDVVGAKGAEVSPQERQDLDALADDLRARVSAALGGKNVQ